MAEYSRSTLKNLFTGGTAVTQTKFEILLDSVLLPEDSIYAGTRFARLSSPNKDHGDPNSFGDYDWAIAHTDPGATSPELDSLAMEWILDNDVSDGSVEISSGTTGATVQINQPGSYLIDCSISYSNLHSSSWKTISTELNASTEGPTSGFEVVRTLCIQPTFINSGGTGAFESGTLSGTEVIKVEDIPYYLSVNLGITGASTVSTLSSRLIILKIADA